ncbi:MAG: hypothetical protein H7Y33_16300 [Cytophagales bacterium]|nr:hypothetical protein [Rhizobacter sp.]
MATMSPQRKRIAMLIVAVGSALLVERVVALAGDDLEVAGPVLSKRARADKPAATDNAASAAGSGTVRLDRLESREQRATPTSKQPALFEAVSWQPPAPKVVAPPPPKPVPPPFPYVYMGGLSDDGVRTTFFAKGERVLPVKTGDTIDAVYRVDQMTEKQMTLTYLPLNETLVVALGGGR